MSSSRSARVFRFIVRWLRNLLIVYLGVLALMWLLENYLVYLPTTAAERWQVTPSPVIEDVPFSDEYGHQLHGWWLPVEGARATTLFFHGNGGNLSDRASTIMRLAELYQTNVFIFDYPGYGHSTGKPNERKFYASAEAAIAWLRDQKQILPENTHFYGESIGGGVALEMAVRHPCRKLVLVKTFTRLPLVAARRYPWLPVDWLMSNRYDNLKKIGSIRCPVFIVNATDDRLVPFDMGEKLFAAAPEPKVFFRDEGHDHNDRLPDEFWMALGQFLRD